MCSADLFTNYLIPQKGKNKVGLKCTVIYSGDELLSGLPKLVGVMCLGVV